MDEETISSDKGASQNEDNFSFTITVPDGVSLTLIDINGQKIEKDDLDALGQQAQNGVITGSMAVSIGLPSIYFEVDAVGEPNNEVSINLKYWGKNVFGNDKTFLIKNTGRGQLLLQSLDLPG